MKKALASLLVAALALPLGGCYSVVVQAADIDKPVSLSHSVGKPAKVKSEFRQGAISWYVLALAPVFSFPSDSGVSVPANELTSAVVRNQLAKGGSGVADLTVTSQIDVGTWFAAVLTRFVGVGWLVQPFSIEVAGKVVE